MTYQPSSGIPRGVSGSEEWAFDFVGEVDPTDGQSIDFTLGVFVKPFGSPWQLGRGFFALNSHTPLPFDDPRTDDLNRMLTFSEAVAAVGGAAALVALFVPIANNWLKNRYASGAPEQPAYIKDAQDVLAAVQSYHANGASIVK